MVVPQLPILNTLPLLASKWKAILDPILANPMTNMAVLKNVSLSTGSNKIPHLLQRMQQGWVVTDIQNGVTIYRDQPFNDTYLYLISSADVVLSLGVF